MNKHRDIELEQSNEQYRLPFLLQQRNRFRFSPFQFRRSPVVFFLFFFFFSSLRS